MNNKIVGTNETDANEELMTNETNNEWDKQGKWDMKQMKKMRKMEKNRQMRKMGMMKKMWKIINRRLLFSASASWGFRLVFWNDTGVLATTLTDGRI